MSNGLFDNEGLFDNTVTNAEDTKADSNESELLFEGNQEQTGAIVSDTEGNELPFEVEDAEEPSESELLEAYDAAGELIKEAALKLIKQTAEEANTKKDYELLGVISASDYLTTNSFDDDLKYFANFNNRKLGMHAEIDKYLTLYPGLAVLGGTSSLGKTTFTCNMIYSLLQRGETVLYFTLEQKPVEIITKFITMQIYKSGSKNNITNTDIKNGGRHREEVEQAKEAIKEDLTRLFMVKGTFETTTETIREQVKAFMQIHEGIKPIVIIDYLQLIAPGNDSFKGNIRQYTDDNLKALKDMQLDNELFVVVISSFNRNSYKEPASYESFKETGMIESTCDYVWALQLKIQSASNEVFYSKLGNGASYVATNDRDKAKMIMEAQRRPVKEVQFVSLKSRNGKQSYEANFNYYPQYDAFIPQAADIAPTEPTRHGRKPPKI